MLRAIAAAKKKNDRIDASKICDCLRCDFLPSATGLHCHSPSAALAQAVALVLTGLMAKRWAEALVRSLECDSLLMDRVERLMTIPAVGRSRR